MKAGGQNEVHKFAAGEVSVWLQEESGSICIKTENKHGDPAELVAEEALELADLLVKLSKEGS
jgi:hypothetical protein